MRKILIFGNSGSGKSTLAQHLCAQEDLTLLDLDTLAWQPTEPPQRTELAQAGASILEFVTQHPGWVIEGCYSDLLEFALTHASEIIFLDLPVNDCLENARQRPWEPHKYPSKAAQDANLGMLLEWIAQYPEREDEFSRAEHQRLYRAFSGRKSTLTKNQ